MVTIEIIGMCILFVVLPALVWRIVYLRNKNKKTIMKTQADSLNKLKSSLNNMINGAQTVSAADLKQLQSKKDKILSKFDTLIKIISDRTGIEIMPCVLHDTVLQKDISINKLDSDYIRGKGDVTTDYFYITEIIDTLLKDNKMPSNADFDGMNSIYKKFKKMPKMKR